MSGVGRKAFAAAAFGVAGALTVVVIGVVEAAVSSRLAEVPAPGGHWRGGDVVLVLAFVGVAGLSGSVVGWRQAATFGLPAPPGSGALPADVGRGVGVAFRGFVLGCALLPAAWGALLLLEQALGGEGVVAPKGAGWLVVPVGYVLVFLVAGALGSFTVLPIALVLGGVAGWLLGRALGTAAPPAR